MNINKMLKVLSRGDKDDASTTLQRAKDMMIALCKCEGRKEERIHSAMMRALSFSKMEEVTESCAFVISAVFVLRSGGYLPHETTFPPLEKELMQIVMED